MDPNETYRLWLGADSLEDARDYAGYLVNWLAKGGFEPAQFVLPNRKDEFFTWWEEYGQV